MQKSKTWALLAGLSLVSLVLAACQGAPVEVPVTVVVKETQVQVETEIQVVTATPEAMPAEPKIMVVCMAQEPETLYVYGGSALVASAVREALHGGVIDQRTYDYQAVSFTKLPNYDDGDAGLEDVEVGIGDTVYDALSGEPVTVAATTTVNLAQREGDPVLVDFAQTPTANTVQTWAQWTQVDGLTWEDGTPVTSDDALFAWDVLGSPDTPAEKTLYNSTASMEALDEKTIKWTGLPGYTDSTYFVNHPGFLPKHAYGHLTPAQMLEDEAVNRDPMYYGPFKLDEWVAGDHITLSKNPTYYRASEGLPHLDQLIYRFIPDTNQLIAQMASGECDMGTQDAAFEGSLPLIRQFEAEALLAPQVVAGTVYEHLDFNALPVDSYTGFAGRVRNDDGSPIFASPEIRQAIAHCIDRQAVVDQTTNGAAVVQHTYTSADHPLYAGDDAVTVYAFDPAKGLELLAKNGWTDSDGDGILDKGGEKFSFVHSTRTNPLRQLVTQVVQAQLKENCMIETTIELYGGEYFGPGPDGLVFGRQYDMGEFAWLTGVQPPCGLYLSTSIPSEENGWDNDNDNGYNNADFDAACNAAQNATDPAVEKEKHAEAMILWTQDLPSLPLFARAKILVTGPNVLNVIMDPTANSELWNVENFDLATP